MILTEGLLTWQEIYNPLVRKIAVKKSMVNDDGPEFLWLRKSTLQRSHQQHCQADESLTSGVGPTGFKIFYKITFAITLKLEQLRPCTPPHLNKTVNNGDVKFVSTIGV